MVVGRKRRVKKAVITAAGWGRRILPASKDIPKEMFPIVDVPAIFYVVEECLEAGISEIAIVVRENDELVERFFSFSYDNHLKSYLKKYEDEQVMERYSRVVNKANLTFLRQSVDLPYGNGTPVLVAKEWLNGDTFAYCLGDDVFLNSSGDGVMKQMVEYYEEIDVEVSGVMGMIKMPKEKVVNYAWLDLGDDGKIIEIIEKPDLQKVRAGVSAIGRMIYTSDIFDYFSVDLLGKYGELWSTDAVRLAIKDGKQFNAKLVEGRQLTVGDMLGFIETNVRFALQREGVEAELKKILRDIIA